MTAVYVVPTKKLVTCHMILNFPYNGLDIKNCLSYNKVEKKNINTSSASRNLVKIQSGPATVSGERAFN